MGRRRAREWWRRLYDEQRRTGLPKAALARREGVSANAFYRWCGVFDAELPPAPAFLPVVVAGADERAASGETVVELPGGARLTWSDSAPDPRWLAALLRALEVGC